jgi:hypothetical protein
MSPANAWPPITPPLSRIFWTTKTRIPIVEAKNSDIRPIPAT